MPGTNHIFFHDDVDGVMSAALYLHSIEGSSYRLYPVTSTMRGEKFDALITSIKKYKYDIKIILDYQYHKDATVWIDHHYNSSFGDCVVKNDNIFYDSKAKSATSMVFKTVMARYHNMAMVSDDVQMVDMVDTASYPNVEMVFRDKSPIMLLRAYLEKVYPSEMTYCRIVECIASTNMDVKEALYRMKIGNECVRDLEKTAMRIKNELLIMGNTCMVNLRRRNQYPRFSECLVLPEIKYSMRFTPLGNGRSSFQIGFNPWQKSSNKINIGRGLGELIKEYVVNFGGHYNVGAGIIKEENVDRLIDDVSTVLNEGECMEKYAVDSSDPIESKAADLVKEGSAKNIEEGRRKASKPESEGSDGATCQAVQ